MNSAAAAITIAAFFMLFSFPFSGSRIDDLPPCANQVHAGEADSGSGFRRLFDFLLTAMPRAVTHVKIKNRARQEA